MQRERNEQLSRFQQLLMTENGQDMVRDLETAWDQHMLIGESPEITAYNVGLRDAYKFICSLQNGDFILEDQ